jgi:hypothetical protein
VGLVPLLSHFHKSKKQIYKKFAVLNPDHTARKEKNLNIHTAVLAIEFKLKITELLFISNSLISNLTYIIFQ